MKKMMGESLSPFGLPLMESDDEYFISDAGKGQHGVMKDLNTGEEEKVYIPRYGVWKIVNGVADEVVETGDDLEALKKKYGITRAPVVFANLKIKS